MGQYLLMPKLKLYKIYNVNKNYFYALQEVDKINITSSFWGICTSFYFCCYFFFSLTLSIGKWFTLGKIWGRGGGGYSSTPLPLHYLPCFHRPGICKIWWWYSLFLCVTFFPSFVLKIHLSFWCYLINLQIVQAVYTQRLEASVFSC